MIQTLFAVKLLVADQSRFMLLGNKFPLIAVANLVRPNADGTVTPVGVVQFMQKSAASPVVVSTAGSSGPDGNGDPTVTTTTTGLLEIRTNPVPDVGGQVRCGDVALGALFNPSAVSNNVEEKDVP